MRYSENPIARRLPSNRPATPLARAGEGGITAALLLILASARPGLALETSLDADAKAVEELNDNLFYTTAHQTSPIVRAWGQGVDGALNFSAVEQRWSSRLNAIFQNRWYAGSTGLDYNNQKISLANSYNVSERSQFGLTGAYNLESTLTRFLETDVGYIQERLPRTTIIGSPTWQYTWSDQTKIDVKYTYSDVTYDQNKNVNHVPNNVSHIGNLAIAHQLNERLQLTANASYTDYSLINPSITQTQSGRGGSVTTTQPAFTDVIDMAAVTLGGSYKFRDDVNFSLYGGLQQNDTSTPVYTVTELVTNPFGTQPRYIVRPATHFSSLGETYSAILSKNFETSEIHLDLGRSINPNIRGALLTYDHYTVGGDYKLSETLDTSLNFTYYENTGSSSNYSGNNRTIYQLRSSLGWKLAESWMLNAQYMFSHVDYTSPGSPSDTAEQNSMSLNLQYLFDKHTF